jgi:hypothetical protein
MHVCVQAGSAIGKCCASGNDVDVPLLYQFLRPGRFQLRQCARGFAALGAAAEAQPRRIDADTADADRFANPIAADELWPGGDIALDLRVECVADGEDPTPGATQGDRLVQWQDFSKQLSGLPIGQMGGPLGVGILNCCHSVPSLLSPVPLNLSSSLETPSMKYRLWPIGHAFAPVNNRSVFRAVAAATIPGHFE